MANHRVFVYGTLKKGNNIRGLDTLGNAEFVAVAKTKDARYTLWNLGAFPAVQPRGDNHIQGEVWEVNQDMMDLLDSIEGYPEFYNRMQIDTTSGRAWIYYIDNPQEYGAEVYDGLGEPGSVIDWNG